MSDLVPAAGTFLPAAGERAAGYRGRLRRSALGPYPRNMQESMLDTRPGIRAPHSRALPSFPRSPVIPAKLVPDPDRGAGIHLGQRTPKLGP